MSSCDFGRRFFQIKERRAPFFHIKARWALYLPVFSGSLPRFSRILHKFSQLLASFQGFCKGFHRFCRNFQGFCPDFHQIKTFGGALASPAPPILYPCRWG